MGKTLLLKPSGLHTAANRLSAVPDGGMEAAANLVIRYEGVAQRRRAADLWTTGASNWSTPGAARTGHGWTAADSGARVDRLVVHHTGSKIAYQDGIEGDAWGEASGTYSLPGQGIQADAAWTSIFFAEARRNLYFSALEGVHRMTAYNATPIAAGVPKPLDIDVASTTTTGALALVDDYAYSYRATIVFRDANGGAWESAPSHRFVARNSATYSYAGGAVGSTRDFTLRTYLPSAQMTGTATSYSLRLYRSKGISGAGNEPSDEQGQVYEVALTSTDISTNKYVDIRDRVPDALIGAAGYFAPSQEGAVAGSERPPMAWDLVWHGRRMLYGNTSSKHRLTLRLLSASAIVANDTVVIAGRTYTAKASGAGSMQFNIVTTYSAQVNIQETARNLVRAINADTSATVYAFYVSGAGDPAGIILIEEQGIGGNSFAATAGGTYSYWAPQLPTSGTAVSSDNDRRRNRVYVSKQDQPEAVPLLSYVDVGNEQDDILRVVRLRDSVFVWKRFDGLYRITGIEQGVPSVQLLDPTVHLIAPRSVAALGNELYALTDLGVVAASDSGVRVVSAAIDDLLRLVFLPAAINGTADAAFATAQETEARYLLWSGTSTVDTLVYGANTDTWSVRTEANPVGASTAAFVAPALNRLFLGASPLYAANYTLRAEKASTAAAPYTEGGGSMIFTATWTATFAPDPGAQKHFQSIKFFFEPSSAITSSVVYITTETGSASVTLTTTAGQEVASTPVPQAVARGHRLTVSFINGEQVELGLLGAEIEYSDGLGKGAR